jgi:putative salt-induced outer membrane protein YdiY
MKHWFVLMAIFLVAAAEARPDVVHFKNGDQLTGELERVQGNKVVLKTEMIGEVRIPMDKVASYTSAGPAVVLVKEQKEVRGTVTLLPGGDWQVHTSSGPQVVQAKSVQIIYPAKTYDEKGYGNRPKVWQDWGGKGALGFSQVRGDQTSRTFSLNFNATRRLPMLPELTEHSRTNFFLSTLFAKSQDAQGNQLSTNNVSSGIRQDFKITDKNFWFLLAQLDHASTQSLDLRQTYGAGLGRDLLRRSNMELQALGGVTYVREHFQGQVFNRNAEALAGEKFSWKMTNWLSLDHALSFYPNLTDGGNYRFDTMTGLNTKITRHWSFSTSYGDHYLSNPLPGHRKNEVIITTGVGVSF